MENRRILIADTETTGLGNNAQVCELGFLEIDVDLNVLSQYESLIKTSCAITQGASQCHGITDEMLVGAPTMAEALDEAPGTFNNVLLIAHNSAFDTRMLTPDWGITKQFDTLRASRNIYPGMPNHKLGTLKSELGLKEHLNAAHTAMSDVWDVYELVSRMMVDTGLSLPELIEDARMPVEVLFMPFGKYVNQPISEIPLTYVTWMLGQDGLDTDLRAALQKRID